VQRDYLIPHIIVYLGRGKEVDNACLTHARGDGGSLGASVERNSPSVQAQSRKQQLRGGHRQPINNMAEDIQLKFSKGRLMSSDGARAEKTARKSARGRESSAATGAVASPATAAGAGA
jgi:hypothetical protein